MTSMHFSAGQAANFKSLKFSGLKVARAWAIKELWSRIWAYTYEGSARKFFKNWFGWASRSKLKPITKAARMIKRHLENILTYLRHPITNAVTEGLNSKIQAIKSNARGFRSFQTTAPVSFSSAANSPFTHYKTGRTFNSLSVNHACHFRSIRKGLYEITGII